MLSHPVMLTSFRKVEVPAAHASPCASARVLSYHIWNSFPIARPATTFPRSHPMTDAGQPPKP